MAVNVMVRDMDLALPNTHDARRLEVLVDGLLLYGGAQLAIDTTLVSPIRKYREHRWHHPGPGPAQKRAHIPGVGRSPFPCAICGLGRRGRRQVVGGDADVPPRSFGPLLCFEDHIVYHCPPKIGHVASKVQAISPLHCLCVQ